MAQNPGRRQTGFSIPCCVLCGRGSTQNLQFLINSSWLQGSIFSKSEELELLESSQWDHLSMYTDMKHKSCTIFTDLGSLNTWLLQKEHPLKGSVAFEGSNSAMGRGSFSLVHHEHSLVYKLVEIQIHSLYLCFLHWGIPDWSIWRLGESGHWHIVANRIWSVCCLLFGM